MYVYVYITYVCMLAYTGAYINDTCICVYMYACIIHLYMYVLWYEEGSEAPPLPFKIRFPI